MNMFSCSNSVSVKADENLPVEEVIIQLYLPLSDSTVIVWENGEQKNDIPSIYGEHDWTIFFKDSLSAEFRHFKTRNTAKHAYEFKLNRKQSTSVINCSVNIRGVNSLDLDIEMSPND